MPAPASPAPVSGPGALSKRTDGGPAQKLSQLPDAKYGENATYQADQRGAPMAQTPDLGVPDMSNSAAANVTPLNAESARPGEPVTSGADLGPGPGSQALGIAPQQVISQDAVKTSQYLPILEAMANMPDALPGSRMFVNLIKAQAAPQQGAT